MERRVLSKKPFIEWSKDLVRFCHITSGLKDEKYPDLMTEKKGFGYHYFLFMDAEGTVLARHDGPFGVAYLEQTARRARTFVDLRARAAQGEEDARIRVFLQRLELDHFPAVDAREHLEQTALSRPARELVSYFVRLKERSIKAGEVREAMDRLDVPKARRAYLEPRLVDAEADELLRAMPADPDERKEFGRKLQAMAGAGRIPTANRVRWNFWRELMEYAETVRDAKLFEQALRSLESYRKAYWEMPAVVSYFEKKDRMLETLKAGRNP